MSQVAPYPKNLPFRVAPRTIGRGAYASIRTAIPLDQPTPVFAVKFIHKEHAVKRGRVSEKQLKMEISLHSFVGQHANVIEWFAAGEDAVWQWIAMEYAEGGDLFDKIEADVGVPEDIAQLYFMQLVAGVSFIHSKGVSHRDLKPENILMSEDGNLKIADFGLACMFAHKDKRKLSSTLCGSPPYIAPEILNCRRTTVKPSTAGDPSGQPEQPAQPDKYDPELADIWSCGVILFVLLAGNTPWDEPSRTSFEFQEYKRTGGRSTDPIWARLPADALSLLRGMMNVETTSRFSFQRIRQHPWCTRPNPHLGSDGGVADPIHLATRMLENLHIDLRPQQQPAAAPMPDRPIPQVDGSMDLDDVGYGASRLSSTQPEAPISDSAWEFFPPAARNPSGGGGRRAPSSTQPVPGEGGGNIGNLSHLLDSLSAEPSMSQFSQQRGVPLSLTQQARRFRDIVPAESLTRFYSALPALLLAQTLAAALHQLGVALPPVRAADLSEGDDVATLRVRTTDGRRQVLNGEVVIDRQRFGDELELLGVRFVKMKGDPLEWRRFFKKVVLLCREAVYVPEG